MHQRQIPITKPFRDEENTDQILRQLKQQKKNSIENSELNAYSVMANEITKEFAKNQTTTH